MSKRWHGLAALLLGTLALIACQSPPAKPEANKAQAKSSTAFDLHTARAYWLRNDTVAWDVPADSRLLLYFSANGTLAVTSRGMTGGEFLSLERAGLVDGELAAKFPHLAGLPRFRLAEKALDSVPAILQQQFAVAAFDDDGDLQGATALQPAGVLDQLFANDAPLGVAFENRAVLIRTPAQNQGGPQALKVESRVPSIRLWAPTARSVKLHLFNDSDPDHSAAQVLPMQRDATSGSWSIRGKADWNRKFYLFEVEVFMREAGKYVSSLVTDPYSFSLSMDSRRTQIVDLRDADLRPEGWDSVPKPNISAPEDITLYELHVRDFSIYDRSVPPALRGTFAAFGLDDSAGVSHLRKLASAGLSHVHLLPAMDCASIPEDRETQLQPGDLSVHAPDSTLQQAAIAPIRDQDGFNWCYDPWHYTAPEGSYATEPDGVRRILEFREMVAGLNKLGLRVIMDVVYNHTPDSGLGAKSVLDRIVPDYYHRLNALGEVETSTCCSNTATEHVMMEKLMLDSLRTWATAYKVDGFRFDLMGHHSRQSIERARDMLQGLTEQADGVNGSDIYLYGEGWNFGEVANDARFEQASQANMGKGSGVGTFNDRIRDAVRGGQHDDRGLAHVRSQGFVNGLFTDPNAENQGSEQERIQLLANSDLIRIGLAGNLAAFPLVNHRGERTTGAGLDYNGQAAGYTSDPQEVINYAAAHDNETLFDINQYKLPLATSTADRVRVQNLANSIIALSQGIPFFHAGQEMLRSKSLDRNSFNSGDWFNLLDFSYQDNGWGRGIPPAWDNEENWPVASELLGNPALAVASQEIMAASIHLQEMLSIRRSSPLFRLRSGGEVIERLHFHNTGPEQVPGLIVMSLDGEKPADLVVLFNAAPESREFRFTIENGARYDLHSVQQASADAVVRTARFDSNARQFTVPARTTAVFVRD